MVPSAARRPICRTSRGHLIRMRLAVTEHCACCQCCRSVSDHRSRLNSLGRAFARARRCKDRRCRTAEWDQSAYSILVSVVAGEVLSVGLTRGNPRCASKRRIHWEIVYTSPSLQACARQRLRASAKSGRRITDNTDHKGGPSCDGLLCRRAAIGVSALKPHSLPCGSNRAPRQASTAWAHGST
jgi:hypothetical protein